MLKVLMSKRVAEISSFYVVRIKLILYVERRTKYIFSCIIQYIYLYFMYSILKVCSVWNREVNIEFDFFEKKLHETK